MPTLSPPSQVARELKNVLPTSPPSSVQPLHTAVQSASLEALTNFLRDEHPQTVAVVVSALPADRAAEFIAHWQPGSQAELLKRIADLEQADDSIIEEIRQELSVRLANLGTPETRRRQGVGVVRSIMAAANGVLRGELMNRLVAFDKDLALCVADVEPPPAAAGVDPHEIAVAFDRFVDLDAELLTQVFTELDHDVAILALSGSQPALLG